MDAAELSIRPSPLGGKGVWADEHIARGHCILRFSGPFVHAQDLPADEELRGKADRYMQIGPSLYLGPSGKLDDYVNHSCNPNTGLLISWETPDGGEHGVRFPVVWLWAIRRIRAGEEITWDYSTSMLDDDWTMRCNCRSPVCRGVIREWRCLPKETRDTYRRLGIVPGFIRATE